MQSLITIFREVCDPRDVNARHSLSSILFLALAATLCGARSCVEIADFAEANAQELAEIVDLPHGTPSHDCFSRTFRLLDPVELAAAFARFAAALREGLGLSTAKGVVAIDGKRLRRGYERGKAHMPPLLVSVFDAETRLSIATSAAPPDAHPGNEVAATLAALKSLVLKRCIVVADALHAHPAMAEAVRASKADYALKIKANNAPLHDAAIAAFATADAKTEIAESGIAFHETSERGHDRSERRRASLAEPLAGSKAFPGLVAFGRVENHRTDAAGKTCEETHYLALSRRLTPRRLLTTVRAYWSVENHLHRQLDVVFHEDDARTRKDYAAQNLGVIRRMALDMLKSHPDKRSPARKMKLALWKKDFFYELFAYMR